MEKNAKTRNFGVRLYNEENFHFHLLIRLLLFLLLFLSSKLFNVILFHEIF